MLPDQAGAEHPGDRVRAAVLNGAIGPMFQCVVNLRTGVIADFEVLARWEDAAHGHIGPSVFIPWIESEGLMVPFTIRMIRLACAAAATWPGHFCLAFNISPQQLLDPELPGQIEEAVRPTGFPLSRLQIEITENALLGDLATSQTTAERLKALGIGLVLDDFGTGHASFSRLQALPFDRIKIDASFVRSMHEQARSRKIVAAVAGLGQSLGLSVVAEGVETEAQARMLMQLGCDLGQGWLFGRAVRPELAQSLLVAAGSYAPAVPQLNRSPTQRQAELAAIYAAAPLGLCFIDPALRCVHVSRLLAEECGLSVEAMVGRTIADVLPELPLDELRTLLAAEDGAATVTCEVVLPGRLRSFNAIVSQVRDEAGDLVGLSVVLTDLTEARSAETIRQETASRLRELGGLGEYLLWIAEPNGTITEAGEPLLALTGWSRQELTGRLYLSLLHADDVAPAAAAWGAMVQGRMPVEAEWRLRGADGWRSMPARITPLLGPGGDVIRICCLTGGAGVAVAVSPPSGAAPDASPSRAEARMMADTISKALDGLGVAMCLFDTADRTVAWNNTFLEFFPEHKHHVWEGEHYRENLRRFYNYRLQGEERQHIDRYITDGIARHQAQMRPFAFEHRGRVVHAASLPIAGIGRVRIWTVVPRLPMQRRPAGTLTVGIDQAIVQNVATQLADGIMVLDQDNRIIFANDEFLRLYDVGQREDILGAKFEDVVHRAWQGAANGADPAAGKADDDAPWTSMFMDNARFAGAPFEVELPGNRWRRILEQRTPEGIGYFSHSDITTMKRQQQDLAAAEQKAREGEYRYRLLAENSSDIIVSLDRDHRILFVSPSIQRILGWPPRLVTGQRFRDLLAESEQGVKDAELTQIQPATGYATLICRFRHRDGHAVWMEAHTRTMLDTESPEPVRYVCNIRDVSKRRAVEEALRVANDELAVLAATDALTGLANRRRFEAALLDARQAALRDVTPLSLLMVDIDHFKSFNDRFGHHVGDDCLRLVANWIGSNIRKPGDLVARYGGEEFAAILAGTGAEAAQQVAERVRLAVTQNRDYVFNRDVPLTVSIGVMTARPDGLPELPADDMVRMADEALYKAKRNGRNRVETA